MLIEMWFDGVCEPVNPGGHGAFGTLIKSTSEVIYEKGGYLGSGPHMSNNVAEYCGFVDGLRFLTENRQRLGVVFKVLIRGDSNLVIKQMSGVWRVHGGLYVPYHDEAKKLLAEVRTFAMCSLEWIPRAENDECDKLSKGELHSRGIKFRIQPEAPPK